VVRYNKFEDEGLGFIQKVFLVLFVILYPMFVSMYTMLPPLIGLAGYILIINFDKNRTYAFSAFFYLLNLDLNLTLPLFQSIIITILIFMFVYAPLSRLIRCRVCLLFTLMVIIDFSYYVSLFIYDFIFNTTTVLGDMLLVYYIVVDVFIGILL